MDPLSGQLVTGGMEEEAQKGLTNMGEILKAVSVVKTTIFLAGVK